MKKTIIFPILGLVILIVIGLIIFSKSNIIPQVIVEDQPIVNGQVTVQNVTAVAPSWLVIQTETNSVPGPVIGYVKINKGENKNISVSIDTAASTPNLFAMIHEDDGEKNKFDFPENDMPLMYNDLMVSQLFSVE